ncbi:MAG: hypothetical protein U0835_12500 [Isosphaeraceae bacterium]
MRQDHHRFRPGTDSLEARIVLSTMTPATTAQVSALSATSRAAVAGSLGGNYISRGGDNRAADAPLAIQVNTTGRLSGLGRVSLAGTLNFGGFLPAGRPDISGTVTITNASGSLTLRLTGNGGNGAIPGHRFVLNASVISGTGAYANTRGIGTVTAQFGANTIRCITAPCPIGGALTLNVNLRPPVR